MIETEPWSRSGHESIADLVHRRVGLSFKGGYRKTAEGAMVRAMEAAGYRDPARYLERLEEDPVAMDALVDLLTIGETYFYRDPAQMRLIECEVLPDLATRHHRPLRLWSAGCASGEEAYTLAILAHRADLGDEVRILGTDVAEERLARARVGRYRKWSFRASTPVDLHEYFEPGPDDTRRVRDYVRSRVSFGSLNFAGDAYPSLRGGTADQDLIVCRNVLIYFDRDTIAEVARRLVASLRERGWLILGAADPRITAFVDCDVVLTPTGLAYRPAGTLGTQVAVHTDMSAPAKGALSVTTDPDEPAWFPIDVPTSLVSGSGDLESSAPPAPPLRPTSTGADPGGVPGGAATASTPRADPDPGGSASASVLDAARSAYASREYDRVLLLVGASPGTVENVLLHARSLANLGRVTEALSAVNDGLERLGAEADLHYLQALLLSEQGRREASLDAARKALYLDRTLVMAHLARGHGLRHAGNAPGARAAYGTALELLDSMRPDDIVPSSDGQPASRLKRVVQDHLDLLEGAT